MYRNRKHTKMRHNKNYAFKKQFVKNIEARTIRKIIFLSKKDASDFVNNIPPLKRNDRLFVISGNLHDSYINRGVALNECHFPDAYMNTAFLLLTMIEWTNTNSIRDGLIFPALFSFRHYLELTMKDSLNRFENNVLDEYVIKREHNLCKLWTKLSAYVGEGEEKNIIHNLLFELNRFDINGELFRYPYEIGENWEKLSSSLPSNLYDIKKLKTTMLKMFRFMEEINTLAYICNDENL